MSGMYIGEARREGLVQGRVLIVVPAHLVTKWERDLLRLFGIRAKRVTAVEAADPADLDPRYDTWVVSLDLFTYNSQVRHKLVGNRASWSMVIFDEAHRLTPTSQFFPAAQELGRISHHLLLLTATPHRGKEHYFRALMHLLDPAMYPWDPTQREYEDSLKPSKLSFLRRMKEELVDHDGGNSSSRDTLRRFPSILIYTNARHTRQSWIMLISTTPRPQLWLDRSMAREPLSSIHAVEQTVRRRENALASGQRRSDPALRSNLVSADGLSLTADDDDAWDQAEQAVIFARTADRSKELAAVRALLEALQRAQVAGMSEKWTELRRFLNGTPIQPGAASAPSLFRVL